MSRVVVSLSTLPPRSPFLGQTLDSLLAQTRRPDQIFVNVPYSARRAPGPIHVPELLAEYQRRAPFLEVIRTEDRGPGTKLLPSIERVVDPEAILITVDDDMIYDRGLVSMLVHWSQRHTDWAVGFRGWNVGPAGGFARARSNFVDVLQGFAGAAYRRRFFGPDVLDAYRRHASCFYVDDVWISGYLAERGFARYLIRPGLPPRATPNTSINALRLEPEKVAHNRCCAECWNFAATQHMSRGTRLPRVRSSYRVLKQR